MLSERLLYLLVLVFFNLGLNTACSHEMPGLCKQFYEMPGQQQETEFLTYPVKKQLDIYRCGLRKKPPERGRAYEIAKGGEKILPELIQELKTEKDEWIQVGIIHVFEIMSEKGYLHDKQDVVAQIREVVTNMKSSFFKEDAQKALVEIERTSQ